jgi:hypothetical protein
MANEIRRLFNRFRAHRSGTFISYDHETRTLTWRPDGSPGKVDDWIQHGLDIDLENIAPGTRLRVQDGEINNESSNMRGGRRWLAIGPRGSLRETSIYTGYACITAIAHPQPRISLVALRLLERVFLPHVVPVHLRHFGEAASTRQTELTVRTNRWDLDMRVRNGRLTAMRRLSNSVTVDEDKVAFDCEGMPDTLISALPGRPLRDLVRHPALMDDDLVIDRVTHSTMDTRAWAHIHPVALTPDEAIARLSPPVALAA